ncbi:hypothetical protein ACOMHN_066675 [Nucella lapillus]
MGGPHSKHKKPGKRQRRKGKEADGCSGGRLEKTVSLSETAPQCPVLGHDPEDGPCFDVSASSLDLNRYCLKRREDFLAQQNGRCLLQQEREHSSDKVIFRSAQRQEELLGEWAECGLDKGAEYFDEKSNRWVDGEADSLCSEMSDYCFVEKADNSSSKRADNYDDGTHMSESETRAELRDRSTADCCFLSARIDMARNGNPDMFHRAEIPCFLDRKMQLSFDERHKAFQHAQIQESHNPSLTSLTASESRTTNTSVEEQPGSFIGEKMCDFAMKRSGEHGDESDEFADDSAGGERVIGGRDTREEEMRGERLALFFQKSTRFLENVVRGLVDFRQDEIFHEIDAVEPLKKIASSTNTVASKLAAEALKVIGEKIPHKLSQQVPLWTVEDVAYWVSQIGFPEYVEEFNGSQVDGDLLLILTCEDLSEGLGMTSSIVRKRFMRELKSLKITADYSASDPTGLDKWLMGLCPELSQYTYYMLRQGVDTYVLKTLTDQELREECGIANSIHRRKILQNLAVAPPVPAGFTSLDFNASLSGTNAIRPIDVFICYRRSSGSQLASLLKVHLQLRGFSVFLDIDRLRAGKFDENLLLSIQMSQHFVLILTHDALDRCLDDDPQEDWVHKEIVAALECSCNIVPIIDSFDWPPMEKLPEDMRGIVRFNCVRWVHEYQDACVDKLETFLRRGRRRMSQTTSHLLSSDSHLSELSGRSPNSCHSSQNMLDVYSP